MKLRFATFRVWNTALTVIAGIGIGFAIFLSERANLFRQSGEQLLISPTFGAIDANAAENIPQTIRFRIFNTADGPATILGCKEACGIWAESVLPLSVSPKSSVMVEIRVIPASLDSCGDKLFLYADKRMTNNGVIQFR